MNLYLKDNNIPKEISDSNYIDRITGTKLSIFGNIDKLNILVGANNAGKSRFMRGLLKKKTFLFFKAFQSYNMIVELFPVLDKISQNPNKSLLFFEFRIYNEQLQNPQFISEAHRRLFERKFTQTVSLNTSFFSTFKADISTQLRTGNAESILNYLLQKKDEIDIALTVYDEHYHYDKHPRTAHSGWYTLLSANNFAVKDFNEDFKLVSTILDTIINNGIDNVTPPHKVYIPILRSARTLFNNSAKSTGDVNNNGFKRIDKLFEDTIIKSYSFDNLSENNITIETGLDLYQSIKRARNERRDKRQRFEEFELFIQSNFFNNRGFEIVAREADSHDQEHIIVSIDGEEHDIHDLGDGIQSIIILLYPIFMAEPKSWIFIEEPELHLHPGLQRIFIESLLLNEFIRKKELRIFFTTHSNHLLDFSLNLNQGVSIFTFQKERTGGDSTYSIQTVKSQDISILNLLDVTNSSVFLANCSIWVEGITDRIYLRSYLNAYLKAHPEKPIVHEDLHFAFFEYAGSNVSHYLFERKKEIEDVDLTDIAIEDIQAQFLANRILLVADSDKGKENKHTLLTKQQSSNFKYLRLPVREIENLLSPELLKLTLPLLSKKFKANIVSTQTFIHSDYKDEYLGSYLESKFGSRVIPKKLKAESGTLATYYKNKLAEVSSPKITWDNMSREAKDLARNAYEYILSHNPQLRNKIP